MVTKNGVTIRPSARLRRAASIAPFAFAVAVGIEREDVYERSRAVSCTPRTNLG